MSHKESKKLNQILIPMASRWENQDANITDYELKRARGFCRKWFDSCSDTVFLYNILCNDVEMGFLSNDMSLLGQMVEDVYFNNAKTYFPMELD